MSTTEPFDGEERPEEQPQEALFRDAVDQAGSDDETRVIADSDAEAPAVGETAEVEDAGFDGAAPVVLAGDAEPAAPAKPEIAEPGTAAQASDGPRIRWAAIIWGLVFAAVAGWGLWTSISASRFTALSDRIEDAVMTGDPGGIAVIAVLVVGALVLLTGLVGLARRLQRRGAAG